MSEFSKLNVPENFSNDNVLSFLGWAVDLCEPDGVEWLLDPKSTRSRLIAELVEDGKLLPLDEEKHPGCYLARSDPRDVARTPKSTFVCSDREYDAGPLNNWESPAKIHEILDGPDGLFRGSMKGKTMFVCPYLLGHPGAKQCRVGIQLTSSRYVLLNIMVMNNTGRLALDMLADGRDCVMGLHEPGTLDPEKRYVVHLPDEGAGRMLSFNSDYGGNAIQPKKMHGLRLSGIRAERDGTWMAEHFALKAITGPGVEGKFGLGYAAPSQCGKTTTAFSQPPQALLDAGWDSTVLGDDIMFATVTDLGLLGEVTEIGSFGVAPGTTWKSNPVAMETISRDAIFTNVGYDPESRTVCWSGLEGVPEECLDWKGNPWKKGESESPVPEHPNARYAAPMTNCPHLDPDWDKGVLLHALAFGARRATPGILPLFLASRTWREFVYHGAMLRSETTAAEVGKTVERFDPMANKPFIAYRPSKYWAHWLNIGERLGENAPGGFFINFFQRDGKRWLWPGYQWNWLLFIHMVKCVNSSPVMKETPIGLVPDVSGFELFGLDIDGSDLEKLFSVDEGLWREEMKVRDEFLSGFDDLPEGILEEHEALKGRLGL